MTEVWKDIQGYEECYQASNFGEIKNKKTGKILKQYSGNIQYNKVALTKKGKKKEYLVHRLIAKTFLENKNNYEQVDHIDCNKLNNNVENLEWVTRSENMKRASKNNLLYCPYKGKKGNENEKSKRTIQYDKNGKIIKIWESCHLASKNLKIKYGNMCSCCRGERKTAGGYIWKYELVKEN